MANILDIDKDSIVTAKSDWEHKDSLNPIYKDTSGYRWDSDRKVWSFPAGSLTELIEKLGSKISLFTLTERLRSYIEFAKQKVEAVVEAIPEPEIFIDPLANGRVLFEHQKTAVNFLLNPVYKGSILADDMGLGKTCSSLVAARELAKRTSCKVIVLCPASLIKNWQKEALGVGVDVEVFSWAKIPEVVSGAFVLIADEAHYCQNPKSARTKSMISLAHSTGCVGAWLLTGTPLKNGRPANLYPLLYAINHPLSKNRRNYESKYCAAKTVNIAGRKIYDASGASNLEELKRLTKPSIMRRTKESCLDLPPKMRQHVTAEASSEVAKEFKKSVREMLEDYKKRMADASPAERDGMEGAQAIVTLNAIRSRSSVAKVESAVGMAQELLESGHQVVIFTEFLESANNLHSALGGEFLNGSVATDERQNMVDRFQSGKSKVFVSTIRAGGVGITLTAASHVILVDRPWTPADALQAEDRCYRIGQTKTVNTFWLQYGDTDLAIDAMLEEKQKNVDAVLGESDGDTEQKRTESVNEIGKRIIKALISKPK